MSISFAGKVAIVTGAGGGLGRAYALELARRGAKVVVNDLGAARDGSGASDAAAQVVEEIRAMGGEAVADGSSVTEYDQMQAMVARAKADWGGVHVLINNAGILRDKSFTKMEPADFDLVVKVHLLGSANATKAVWDLMREQNYGRILMTASSTGLFGNFGQLFGPENVVPAALFLVSDDAPSNAIVGAGAGAYHSAFVTMNPPVYLGAEDRTVEGFAANWAQISDRTGDFVPQSGSEQSQAILSVLQAALKG
eukprot:gene14174-14293_t